VIHNRFLPDWLHRVANGLAGAGLASLAVCVAVRGLGLSLRLFAIVPLAAALRVAASPQRSSLVEGCAGGDGYDELGLDPPADHGAEDRDRGST